MTMNGVSQIVCSMWPDTGMFDIDLQGKRVLIREDLNVPLVDGVITDDQRIQAALPTIEQALAAGALVTIVAHLMMGNYIERRLTIRCF